MKRVLRFLVLLTLIACVVYPVSAEAAEMPNWDDYTYEELVEIRTELDAYIQKLEKQYAIEHGNRTIILNESEQTIYQGKTFAFTAEVKKVVEDAPETTGFVWSSSDETIAKVSTNGVVTAVGYGDAVITCTASDDENIFVEATVHVVLPVTALELDNREATLVISDRDATAAQMTLHCTVIPDNAYIKTVQWSSSNEEIAVVDEKGVIRAIAPGTATITATSEDSFATPKTATCRVTIQQAVSAIALDSEKMTLNVAAGQNLTATISPENASKKELIWESSDPAVVTVSNGRVTAVSTGTATITCTAADESGSTASCEVTVIQMVNSLRIDTSAATVTVNKNESVTFDAVIAPETATNQKLNWESSDKEVAVVDANGKVTAVGGGAATITCASTDGSEKTASINIYVPSIAVDAQEYTVTSMDGLSIPFKYYGKQENFSFTPDACMYFSVELNQSGENMMLNIIPDKAGMATVTLKDKADSRSQVTIKIQVEHSACYDSTSYPTGNYTNIMRSPSSFKGKNMSVYGRILQLQKGWFGSVALRVATQGRWDNVFYITCSSGDVEGIIEDDYITVYGECDGTKTYTTIMGGSVTIPSMNAEKIFLGRH